MSCEVRVLSAMEKVFPDENPVGQPPELTVLRDDVISYQVAFRLDADYSQWAQLQITTDLLPWVTVREVKLSPSGFPCHPTRQDAGYLRNLPGMYPDRLERLPEDGRFKLVCGQWRSLWIDIETDKDTPAGVHTIELNAVDANGKAFFRVKQAVQVLGSALEPTDMPHTEWFHADCIADYYGLATDSDAFLDQVKPFVQTAVKRGINTILTPMFTPPLDTAEGGERTTVQLVGVRRSGDQYTFDFSRFEQWIAMCEDCGVRYFELSHLFSQWGAKYAPKIMGEDEKGYRMLFGWHTPGTGAEYLHFLDGFLPALRAKLEAMGIADRCLLHISDEPHADHLEAYRQAKQAVDKHMHGMRIVDALSDYEFYASGAVDTPIVANDHIEPFLKAGVTDLWTYYCTSQSVDVSNRFFALPSSRCRIIGTQIYLYHIKGFLHWGYNFYNTQYSTQHINPYAVTDAGDAFPSGDAFLVYPGADGQPEESIRLMMMDQAFRDVRAFQQLERLAGRAFVEEMIAAQSPQAITFSSYPLEAGFLPALRNRVNQEIAKRQ